MNEECDKPTPKELEEYKTLREILNNKDKLDVSLRAFYEDYVEQQLLELRGRSPGLSRAYGISHMPYRVVAMAKAFSDPVKIVPARTLVRDKVAMQITEIREDNPGKYGSRTLIVFLIEGASDKKEYGVFNEHLLTYGIEVGDVIRIGLSRTKNGMLCYVPIEQNGKPVRHTDSKELEIKP